MFRLRRFARVFCSALWPGLLLCAGRLVGAPEAAASHEAILRDWLEQDAGHRAAWCFRSDTTAALEAEIVAAAARELGAAGAGLVAEAEALLAAAVDGADARWRALYTRWDYNDRGQIYPQALFQMNADGTGQTEYYGNNSWFPTTLLHARGIPGSGRVMAIATGHHTAQGGKLVLVDPARGRQEASGVTMLAPVEPAVAVRIDRYGQTGVQYQHPYPLSETELLVSCARDPMRR